MPNSRCPPPAANGDIFVGQKAPLTFFWQIHLIHDQAVNIGCSSEGFPMFAIEDGNAGLQWILGVWHSVETRRVGGQQHPSAGTGGGSCERPHSAAFQSIGRREFSLNEHCRRRYLLSGAVSPGGV